MLFDQIQLLNPGGACSYYRRELVGAAEHEFELLDRDIERAEQRSNAESVVLGSVFDQFDWGLEVIEEAMYVGKQNLDIATGLEELRELDHLCFPV